MPLALETLGLSTERPINLRTALIRLSVADGVGGLSPGA